MVACSERSEITAIATSRAFVLFNSGAMLLAFFKWGWILIFTFFLILKCLENRDVGSRPVDSPVRHWDYGHFNLYTKTYETKGLRKLGSILTEEYFPSTISR